MNTRFKLIALCAFALSLGACDKTTPGPLTPLTGTAPSSESAAMAGSAASSPVPSAESVLSPATTAQTDPKLGRSNGTLSSAQESTAMPMPGQNNDHSAPLNPAK